METTPQPMQATTTDWQEEVYQKIKALKDLHFDELNDLYQKLTLKCQQQEALGQTQMQSEQIEKLRNYRNAVKTTLAYLTIPKTGISAGFKDKIGSFEKQILYILNLFKARKPAQNQQGQQQQLPPPSGLQSLSVQQQQQQLPPPSAGHSVGDFAEARLYEDMSSPQQHQQQPKKQKRSSSHVMGKGKKCRMSCALEEEILCSICLDPVMDNGDRSTAKLRCGHQFHLDCIGSAFNVKASMQCPTCRRVENGQWRLYRAFSDSDEDDWTEPL